MKPKYFSYTPFIDSLFCSLLMLIAILFLLKTEEKNDKMHPPNVLYQVVLTWPGDSEDDLDLYVKSASDHVASFGNREGGQGSLISLNHDALGRSRNNTLSTNGVIISFNEEIVSFRGLTEGENIVNVHAYLKKDKSPTKCSIKLIKIKPFKEVIIREKEFNLTGEEKTAFRFKTDENGVITEINEIPAILTRSL